MVFWTVCFLSSEYLLSLLAYNLLVHLVVFFFFKHITQFYFTKIEFDSSQTDYATTKHKTKY